MTDDTGDIDPVRKMAGLQPWSELSAIEQSLVRGGLRKKPTAGTIQAHGMALRWDGAPGAPTAGGYSRADLFELVPEFADTAAGLIAHGVLNVRCTSASYAQDTDQDVGSYDLDRVLQDPATWVGDVREPSRYWLDVSQPARERWHHPAYFAMARTDYPALRELSNPEREILVSAMEASGMLTGHLGIWSQPDPALTPSQRLADIDALLTPLLPFVQDEQLEVQHRADARSGAYTVIPLDELRSAFNDTEIWHDHAEAELFEGAHAVFTFAGYATWHTQRGRPER